MGKSKLRFGVVIWGATGLVLGCSGNSKQNGNDAQTVCDAGVRRCEGLNVKVCSEDGSAESIEQTCLPSQSCSAGACQETSCVPNTKFCKDGAIYKCDSSGGGSSLSQQCGAGRFCREKDEDASCSSQACSANEPLCEGNVATSCQIDGSGPRPGGTDCAASNQACYQGQCRDRACTSGMKVCQHDDVFLCSQNGTDLSLLAECAVDEVCDGAMGACRPKLCEPGKVSCDGLRVVTCNEFGSAWLAGGVDCGAESKQCVAGACKNQVCTPSTTFCQDGNVYSCDSLGLSSSLSQTCQAEWQHCAPYGSYAYCESNQCQPGQAVCDSNVVKTCTASGTLPPTGTACASDTYCDGGVCKPRNCDVDRFFCQSGDIYYCSYDGPPQLAQTCEYDRVCKPVTDGATCAALPCSPTSTVCLGNKVGTCAADGLTLGKVTEDCAAAASICTADLKCAKTAMDTLGIAENVEGVGAGTFIGDAIDVTSPRKVTEMSLNLVLAASRELRWVIYEQTGQAFTARIDKLVSNVSGSGFQSSGALSYSLKAGKRYVLGVVVSGGDAVAYYDTAPFGPVTSFGNPVGRVVTYYQSVIDAGNLYQEYLYQMKITTESP